jgi:bacillithiol biosynthesis deacetylase BshB1
MTVDVLAIAAHPDDIELSAGGLLARAHRAGYRTAAVDLTRGEMGSRGTPEEREAEAQAAARVIGLDAREILDLGDARLADNHENRLAVARKIREYRPRVVLASYWLDRHPDHATASQLVSYGAFYARLPRIDLGLEIHAPSQILHYLQHETPTPTVIVDITDVWEVKREAIECYQSQFGSQASSPPGYQFLGISDYLWAIEARARFHGSLIHTRYGEPYLVRDPLQIDDPVAFWAKE